MKVGVDIDNTTLVFQPYWAELYEEWFGVSVDSEILDTWSALVTGTHFESSYEFFEWFARAGGWDTMPWEKGAPGGIDALLDGGHSVTFVTARSNPHSVEAAKRWFAASPWGKQLGVQLVTHAERKSTVPCSIYVDDAAHNAEEIIDAGKPVIVFDKPWNQELDESYLSDDHRELLFRAHTWEEVVFYVNEFGRAS
jgi:hypothetical protein